MRLFLLSLFTLFNLSIPLFSNTILLKSGETVKGKLVSQDADSLVVQEANGKSRTINKKKILKVVYKEVSEEALQEIRKEEEKKLAQASEREIKERELQLEEELKKKELSQQTETGDSFKNSTSVLFAPYAKSCLPFSSNTEWYWLYGNVPFSEPDWSTLLPKDQKTVLIRHTSNWKDTLTTIFIGTLTSISRKTRVIEVCDADSKSKTTSGKQSIQN